MTQNIINNTFVAYLTQDWDDQERDTGHDLQMPIKLILVAMKRKQEDKSQNELEFNPRVSCRLTWLKIVNVLYSVTLINLIRWWCSWVVYLITELCEIFLAFPSVQLNKNFPVILLFFFPFFFILWELMILKYTKFAKKIYEDQPLPWMKGHYL